MNSIYDEASIHEYVLNQLKIINSFNISNVEKDEYTLELLDGVVTYFNKLIALAHSDFI